MDGGYRSEAGAGDFLSYIGSLMPHLPRQVAVSSVQAKPPAAPPELPTSLQVAAAAAQLPRANWGIITLQPHCQAEQQHHFPSLTSESPMFSAPTGKINR